MLFEKKGERLYKYEYANVEGNVTDAIMDFCDEVYKDSGSYISIAVEVGPTFMRTLEKEVEPYFFAKTTDPPNLNGCTKFNHPLGVIYFFETKID